MRALFTCIPGFGHFHPLVPLARAAVEVGHEVAFATAPRFCERVIEPAGFPAFPAGLSPDAAYEQTAALIDPDEADGEWYFGANMFAAVAGPAKVPDLTKAIQAWQPDVVVHDVVDFAGPLAAAAAGLPWCAHGFGALPPPEFWELAGTLVAPTWTAWDVEPLPWGGAFHSLYLDVCPPSLQPCAIDVRGAARSLRPVGFDTTAASSLPPWVEDLGEAPTVYVTMGTVVNDAPEVFEVVLEALRNEPWNIVVTVGPNRDPGELGLQPANVHVERYLPQSLLFPKCDVVVCHGGSGTVLGALAHGLPLLILPQGADQFRNADQCASVGAATQLRGDDVAAPIIKRAVRALIEEGSYRRSAARIRREIEQMPLPAEFVPTLEELVRHHGPPSARPVPIA